MAIKEFIIGPQNYFEEGYFDGDYTQTNVSKSYLQCDIDRVIGGRVVTGEYYLDNYIDGTYYHANAMAFGLICNAMVVQEATITLQAYYEDGYFAEGYFTPTTGSSFSLYCRTGEDKFAEAILLSSASMSIDAGKVMQVSSDFAFAFTQTSVISHIEGADLFALSDAALAVQVDRIRDNNIEALAAFSVSTDVQRTQQGNADADAMFEAIINGLRSRDVNLETQAAFSFVAQLDIVKEGAIEISTAFTQTSIINGVLEASAYLEDVTTNYAQNVAGEDSEYGFFFRPGPEFFTIVPGSTVIGQPTWVVVSIDKTVDYGQSVVIRIRGGAFASGASYSFTKSAGSRTSVTATISHIHGADITAFTTGELTASLEITRDYSAALESAISLSSDALRIYSLESASSSEFALSNNGEYVKGAFSSISSEFTQSSTISHIHGADITAFTNGALSVDPMVIRGGVQTLSIEFSLSSILSANYLVSSSIQASLRLNAAAAVLLRNISIVQNNGGDFTNIDWTTENSKWGEGSLKISAYNSNLNNQYSAENSINNGADLKYFTNGYTYASIDGLTWTKSSNNLPINPRKVIWTGTQYACRQETAIYRSTDGITWTSTTVSIPPTTSTYTAQGDTIEFFGSYWYIGTQASNGVAIHRSNNLSTWTPVTTYQSSGYIGGERKWRSSVNTGTQLFFLAQIGGTGNLRVIAYTANGTTWNLTSMPTTYGSVVVEMAFGGGELRLSSYNFSPSYNFFLHSIPVATLSTWTTVSTSNLGEYTKLSYLGSAWFYLQAGSWYANGVKITSYNFTNSKIGIVGFISNKYVIPKNNGIIYSSSATSGYQSQVTSVNTNIPGTITYSDATNDLSNWQTLDFWCLGSAAGSYIVSQFGSSWNLLSYIANGYLSVDFVGTQSYTDNRYLSFLTRTTNWTNGWNHIRISRNSISGVVALFCNGVKITGSGSGTFPETNDGPIVFGGAQSVAQVVYFDEFLVSDQLITDPSAASITVPTGPWTNNANTDLLLHFNYSVTDDSRFQVVPSASVTTIASVSAELTGIFQTGRAEISSTATITAIISGINEAHLVAFSDAAVFTQANIIKDNASALVSNAETSTIESRLRDFDSAVQSTASVSVDSDRLRDTSIACQCEFTQSTVVNRTADAVATVESQSNVIAYITRIQEILLIAFNDANLSAVGNVIRSAESNQSCQSTVNAIGVKTVFVASEQLAEVSLSVSGVLTRSVIILTEAIATELAAVVATRTLVADLLVVSTLSVSIDANTKEGVSAVSSSTALSVDANITASGASNLEIQASQETSVSKITGYSSALSATTEVYVLANVTGKIELYAFTNASLDVVIDVTRELDSALSCQATFVANTADSLAKIASAQLSLVATQSAVAVKRVDPALAFESVAIELAVVIKAASGDIDLSSAFSLDVTANVSRSVSASISSAASISSQAIKTARITQAISSEFTQTAANTRVRSSSISTQAVASTLNAVVKIADFFTNCDAVATLVASANVIKGVNSSLVSIATFTSATVKLVITTAAITSSINVIATVGLRKQFTATVASALTFVVEIREIKLDEIVYVIPGEIFSYTIISETRIHDVYGETRIRSITGESRERTITGESRIHTI